MRLGLIILLSVFVPVSFVSAQIFNPPNNSGNQNQPPFSNPDGASNQEEQPLINQIQSPAQSKETPLTNQTSGNNIDQQPVNQATATPYGLYFAYVVAGLILFWFGWWRKWLKRKKEITLPAEDDGTVCHTCGGTGKITKHRTKTVACGHCKGTGNDICHHCSGTGRDGLGYGVPLENIENYPPCRYCNGKGFPKIRGQCEFCGGKRNIEFQEPYEEVCPTCKGSGRVRK